LANQPPAVATTLKASSLDGLQIFEVALVDFEATPSTIFQQ
jgi:hypothetical protein